MAKQVKTANAYTYRHKDFSAHKTSAIFKKQVQEMRNTEGRARAAAYQKLLGLDKNLEN